MNRITVIACVVAAAGAAHAQAPSPAASTTLFFEQRVSDELATEGIVLSRKNLRLQIEEVDGKLVVSIVERTTGRALASTTVDTAPVEREAAVAMLMQIAADLVDQIGDGTSEAPAQAPSRVTADAGARNAAELGFQRSAIRFGKKYGQWVTYQGNQELSPEQFYSDVGRPDLAEAYRHRHRIAVVGDIAGAVGLLGGLVLIVANNDPHATRSIAERHPTETMIVEAGEVVGLIGIGLWSWYAGHPHPIDERDAKALADAYNQHLRADLMLPVARSEPLMRDLQLAPVVTADNYGLALGGRF
jgi:hypothetical protein